MKKTDKLRSRTAKTTGRGKPFDNTDLVLRSARECFERFGVEKTRLEDIAKLSGISRPLLYKLFNGREALMDAVINFEIEKLVTLQKKRMRKTRSFSQAVIEGSITGIELARKDDVLMDLIIHSSVEHLPGLLLDSAQPAHQTVLNLWQGFFEEARQNGELRADINDDDLIEWLMSIHYMFLLREEVSLDRVRSLLALFVCPSLDHDATSPR